MEFLKTIKLMSVGCIWLLLAACSSNSQSGSQVLRKVMSDNTTIKLNQLGYSKNAQKIAVVPAIGATSFSVVEVETGAEVFTRNLSPAKQWEYSNETVSMADFSAVTKPGTYKLKVAGLSDSDAFVIDVLPYVALNEAAIKAYYFNRSSSTLLKKHAGLWARDFAHPDTSIVVHESAASKARPAGFTFSAPKGWYDAGDYGKYIVNSGISTYTLLAALEHFPNFYKNQDLNIPESGNGIPDILDEIMWNIDWMLDMQDPNDGGVYHKLTTKSFASIIMPNKATETRYVVQKGTAAALNFAAVMATASRVLADYESDFPGKSAQALAAAKSAWNWAQKNPEVAYRQPKDVRTGGYGDRRFTDEFVWAAAELFITTKNEAYYNALKAMEPANAVPSWSQSLGLAWMSLAHHTNSVKNIADKKLITAHVTGLADQILSASNNSAYGVSMERRDFIWGSNGVAMNKAMMLLQAYHLTHNNNYVNAAQSLLDYVLGRNPTDYSYVTGFGLRPAMNIHHRQSEADGIAAPVPGFLAGGPHSGQQDGCTYASKLPALSYLDDACSYSTNEVTINWNAPLVYVTGALETIYSQ